MPAHRFTRPVSGACMTTHGDISEGPCGPAHVFGASQHQRGGCWLHVMCRHLLAAAMLQHCTRSLRPDTHQPTHTVCQIAPAVLPLCLIFLSVMSPAIFLIRHQKRVCAAVKAHQLGGARHADAHLAVVAELQAAVQGGLQDRLVLLHLEHGAAGLVLDLHLQAWHLELDLDLELEHFESTIAPQGVVLAQARLSPLVCITVWDESSSWILVHWAQADVILLQQGAHAD